MSPLSIDELLQAMRTLTLAECRERMETWQKRYPDHYKVLSEFYEQAKKKKSTLPSRRDV